MARNHRPTVIIEKEFFHCYVFLHWTHRPDQVLHSSFILALEVEFELALQEPDEGYDTDNNYDLPKLLKRTACIYAVTSSNRGSFDPSGSQGGAAFITPSTQTRRTVGPHFTEWIKNA